MYVWHSKADLLKAFMCDACYRDVPAVTLRALLQYHSGGWSLLVQLMHLTWRADDYHWPCLEEGQVLPLQVTLILSAEEPYEGLVELPEDEVCSKLLPHVIHHQRINGHHTSHGSIQLISLQGEGGEGRGGTELASVSRCASDRCCTVCALGARMPAHPQLLLAVPN